jgi:hypothetical protein
MRRRRLCVASVVSICVMSVVGAGCGGGSQGTGPNKQAADPCRSREAARKAGIEPARMLPSYSFPYSEAVMGPVRNGWVAGDRRGHTVVYAGGQGYADPDKGKFLILRHGRPGPHDRSILVDRAGAIKITKAPLGCTVATWAQRRGNLEFTSTNGVSGTLHLKNDKVTLSP